MKDVLGLQLDPVAGAAWVRDGEVRAAAAEERFTRQALDPNHPRFATEFVLAEAGVAASGMSAVAVCGEPMDDFTRVLSSSLASAFPSGAPAFVRNMEAWVGQRLWTRDRISRRLDVAPAGIQFLPRHLCLATEAAAGSGWSRCGVLVVDTASEWSATSIYTMEGGVLREVLRLPLSGSIGLVCAAFAMLLGLRPWDSYGRLAELAAFGRPIFAGRMRRLLAVDEAGDTHVEPGFFRFAELWQAPYGTPWTRRLTDTFGAPRDARRPWPFVAAPGPMTGVDPEDQRCADIAASLQVAVEEALVGLARRARALVGVQQLCVTGPVFQNLPAVERLRDAELYVAPDPTGGPIGAALQAAGGPWPVPARFLGRAWDEERDIAAIGLADPVYWQRFRRRGCRALHGVRLDVRGGLDDAALAAIVVEDLRAGRVVGVAQGRFGRGPWAIDNRIVLADPGNAAAVDQLRTRVVGAPAYAAPMVVGIGPATGVPRRVAGTGVDGHAWRLDVDAGLVHTVLHISGLPELACHGLAEDGDPLASSPAEALLLWMRTDLDTLVLGRSIVRKEYP